MNTLFEDQPDVKPDRPADAARLGGLHLTDEEESPREEPFVISEGRPEPLGETVRKSGLAYSAAIALFASVVFMLVLGWLADLLLGSSPWGIVGGILLGSAIGFVQFFRITSQIFHK